VLIGRCAWHPGYRGYPFLSGITSWRGWNVRFTDGICETCLARFRAEHERFFRKRSPGDSVATASGPNAAA
jgi:hypothetical protein